MLRGGRGYRLDRNQPDCGRDPRLNATAGWILVPLVLALLCCGIGLLAERAAGLRLPGALVPAVGLAGLVAAAGITTLWDATAEATRTVVTALAVGGFALEWRRVPARLRGALWPVVLALVVYGIYAAPPVLSGQASIAGYVKLDDSATWLALTDHVMEHGRDLDGLAPSSYQRTLDVWLGTGYPVGAFLPVGVAAELTGQDVANAYGPTIAFVATLLALGMYACVRPFLRSGAVAAACAASAVQASLFFGYLMWGGVKEAVAAALLPPLAFLAVEARDPERGTRAFALACLAAGALFGVLGVNGAAWAGPALAAAAVLWLGSAPRRAVAAAGLVALLALAGVPALATLDFARQTTEGAITASDELGNLAEPLPLLQGAGLWPVGDLRADPDPMAFAVLLAVGGLLAAGGAAYVAMRERAFALPALAGLALAGGLPALAVGAPWVDAKALAIVAPALLLATAALAGRALESERLRTAGAVGAAVLLAGCVWSTLLVARDVYVAPRERLAELEFLGGVLRGQGPTLVLDFEIYADRHFLREADPEGATDLRVRPVARRDGTRFPDLTTAEVDEIATGDLWVYRSIVRRRSPVASRPPAGFARIWAGPWFEAWQRDPGAQPPLQRLPLGDALQPAAVPDCAAVEGLAKLPGVRVLSAVPREQPLVVELAGGGIPPPWQGPGGVRPVVDGSGVVPVRVPSAGRWRVWVGGGVLGRLDVSVGAREAGSHRHELAHEGQWLRYGAVELAAGEHVLRLSYARGRRPGRGAAEDQWGLGPLALTRAADEAAAEVVEVPADRYRTLCDGRSYDWIEAYP